MDRLEAIEWLKSIKEKYVHGGDDFYDSKRRSAINFAIIDLSNEDFVEVVRCKDCKHLGFKGLGDGVCNRKMVGILKPDDFCSYGERKDGQ